MNRTLFPAIAIVAIAPLLLADQIIFKNGDRLTGTIVELDDTHLKIIGPYGTMIVAADLMLTYNKSEQVDSGVKGEIISKIQVVGLKDAKQAKVMLINAKGPKCRDSVVLSEGAAWTRLAEAGLSQGRALPKAGPRIYNVEIASQLPPESKACWCGDGGDDWKAEEAGLAVMAPGKAVAYFPNRPHAKGFLLCSESQFGFTVNMRALREVPVTVWAREGNHIPSMAKDDIANADWVFDKQLAGVTLKPMFHTVKEEDFRRDLPLCFPDNPQDPINRAACCQQVSLSEMFNAGAVNVYYGVGAENFTCILSPTVPASFIHDVPVLGDAVHEIGHALGLSQKDTDPAGFDTGHTSPVDTPKTAEGDFSCSNVMWEATHFLKADLSVGQAFWMSQSCGSFAGRNGACLACSDKPGAASPCPRFSLGHSDTVSSPCVKRAVEVGHNQTLVPRHQLSKSGAEEPASCDIPRTTYRDGPKMEADLTSRYDALKAHVRSRPDLRLGAVSRGEFLDHWEPQVALNLANREKARVVVPHRIGSVNLHLTTLVDKISAGAPVPPVCPSPPSK